MSNKPYVIEKMIVTCVCYQCKRKEEHEIEGDVLNELTEPRIYHITEDYLTLFGWKFIDDGQTAFCTEKCLRDYEHEEAEYRATED